MLSRYQLSKKGTCSFFPSLDIHVKEFMKQCKDERFVVTVKGINAALLRNMNVNGALLDRQIAQRRKKPTNATYRLISVSPLWLSAMFWCSYQDMKCFEPLRTILPLVQLRQLLEFQNIILESIILIPWRGKLWSTFR